MPALRWLARIAAAIVLIPVWGSISTASDTAAQALFAVI